MTSPTSPSYPKLPAGKLARATPSEIEQRKRQYAQDCVERGIEYGTCFCRCGGKTPVSNKHDWRRGYIKDLPTRMLPGHHFDSTVALTPRLDPSVPYGYCHCLCGDKTPLALETKTKIGWVRGEPIRYIYGHQHRVKGVLKRDLRPAKLEKGPRWIAMGCGYETPCHVWQWATTPAGYGIVVHEGRNQVAHRVAYILKNGPIPDEMKVHHKCENPPCINTDHLQHMSNADNIRLSTLTNMTEEIVFKMFALRKSGMKWKAIAVEVGITYESARAIGCGKRWGDVRERALRI